MCKVEKLCKIIYTLIVTYFFVAFEVCKFRRQSPPNNKGGNIMKKQVHYTILEDMKKYIKDFDPKEYESSYEHSTPSVIEEIRKYYDEHLPVDVTAWVRVNEPSKDLIFGSGLGTQVCLVRDQICRLLYNSYEEWASNPPMVISTHRSKSVKLPVYQIILKQYGIKIVLRNNFYDWKISIKSEVPLDFDFMGLFDYSKEWAACYCEGFPKDDVYGSYSSSCTHFTFELNTHYELYTFAYLLSHYLDIK